MAIFRVEKNSNYTVMSNHHLRDKSLSLKAKGLLSQILSLPEEWDYTLQGLACILCGQGNETARDGCAERSTASTNSLSRRPIPPCWNNRHRENRCRIIQRRKNLRR